MKLGERREGRLEFRGPSTTRGYFRNESKTRELYSRRLARQRRSRLYGGWRRLHHRAHQGHHHSRRPPYLSAGSRRRRRLDIPGIRKGCVAVFGVTDRVSGTERLVVLAETRETDPAVRADMQIRAQEIAGDIAGTPPDEIVLAPPRTVPKTSSGKIRRSAAKELYESGQIGVPRRALWRQILRLTLASITPQLMRQSRVLRETIYAAWWWIVIGLGATIAWPAVMILPRVDWRWRAIRSIARAALAAMGVPVSVSGVDRIPRGNAMLVFNHSSYMDALVLSAVLPGEPVYVVKRELAGQISAGPFLRRLGTLFVERYDVSASLADTEAIIAAARQGRNVVYFPEGTFTRRAGLSGFYLGAFKVAAEAGLPVLPGIIRGTRSMLRSDQWFPRWTPLSIQIENAVKPSGTEFAALLQLREAVRKVILAHCGEPDLGELVKPDASPETA